MRETLNDIIQKMKSGVYKNEEHIRLAVVARVLSQLGWNIWDPSEVNCEFNPVPHEDKTRVDIALFSMARKLDVFIEVKPLGKIRANLAESEMQLRNYNRDNTAPFSVITDGQIWRFYLSQAGGKFSEKCFKVIDLLDDDLDDIQISFSKFLHKQEISNGNAVQEATNYLRLTEKQRIMEDMLPRAKKLTLEPPYPRLPEVLVSLVAEMGIPITVGEAETFIEESKGKETQETDTTIAEDTHEKNDISEEMQLSPDNPPNLGFTKITEARFGEQSANNWNNLLICGIKIAILKHISVDELQSLSVPIQRGRKNSDGYAPIPGTDVSFHYVDANRAWSLTLRVAKKLNTRVIAKFAWRDKENAAHPGKKAVLQWP